MVRLRKDLSNWALYAEELRKQYKRENSKMKSFIASLAKYNKLWIALLGAVVNLLVVYFAGAEWVNILVSFLTAIGVYSVRNEVV